MDSAATRLDATTAHWDQPTDAEHAQTESSWEKISPSEVTAPLATEFPKPSSKPDGTRSWASIFNKPAPAQTLPKVAPPVHTHQIQAPEALEPPTSSPEPDILTLPLPISTEMVNTEIPATPPFPEISTDDPTDISPSKDELTETNLEQLPDTSAPALSATAASTVASTVDIRTLGGNSTPVHNNDQNPIGRPPMGGYATSAYKATGIPGRSASFQRKILGQQEAVVMPGKHAVDRAAVQFGSMGLNGTVEDPDVDSDREEAETRAQPPQHSPIAPRAALPPATQPQVPVQASGPEPLPTPKQAPGLPPANHQSVAQHPSQPIANENGSQQTSQSSYGFSHFNNRYNTQAGQHEASTAPQKAYEPVGQQTHQAQTHHDVYSNTTQTQPPPLHQAQSHAGGYSSAAGDNTSYHSAENPRNTYQNYYGNYNQQSQQSPQDPSVTQNRMGSAFGTNAGEQVSQPTNSQSQQPQTRYGQAGEAQTSGNSTPNPTLPSQHQAAQQQHNPQIPPQQASGHAGGQQNTYPYGNPYYTASPYYSAYMNQMNNHPYGRERPLFDDVRRYDEQYLAHNPQFSYGGSHGGFGGGPFGGSAGKQGMYGQPHQGYGSVPQTSYEQHSASPGNVSGFGHQPAPTRDGTTAGSIANYGRAGSVQPDNQHQYSGGGSSAAVSNYGNVPELFVRSSSGFPNQNHPQANQSISGEDSVRGYGDSAKVAGGPSPALGQPSGRPGSAANNMQVQSALLPPNNQAQGQGQQQQGYGGYPGHVNHQIHSQQGSQYGAGPGSLGNHHGSGATQAHQASTGYGGYSTGGFGGSYYGGAGNRGGWSGSYGNH